MEKLTYKQAYDKIIEAYFKDEIKPLDPKFCFCGNLCDKTDHWYGGIENDYQPSHGYTATELMDMEAALLEVSFFANPIDEEKLFAGMSAALDVLKEIHRSRGENVDELPVLTKRVLISRI